MLDLCCGARLVLYAARERFGSDAVVHGVDISSASLEIARAKAARFEEARKETKAEMEFGEGSAAVEWEWILGDESVRDVLVRAGLECRDCFVTVAYRRRGYWVEEAEGVWERVTGNPVSDVGGMGDKEREGSKRLFVPMMRDYAGDSGGLVDKYGVLVGIGVRRT